MKDLYDIGLRGRSPNFILNFLLTFKEIVFFCWLPSHINIRGNELADLEAKSA